MNPTPTPTPSAPAGIHRGVWIGGGLMGLTIIALATTLVVKNSDSVPSGANAATSPLVSTTVTPGATTPDGLPAAPQPTAATPEHEAVRAARHHSPHDTAAPAGDPQQMAAAGPAACATCGVIDGYSVVQVKGQNNGIGAVAGGLGGALVGSKIAGRSNHTLGGVIGAVGGGLLGNAIESHERTTTAYDVRVRMADGTLRTVRQASVPTVGQRVSVEGNVLHPIADGQV